jgi:hypothetical protein
MLSELARACFLEDEELAGQQPAGVTAFVAATEATA